MALMLGFAFQLQMDAVEAFSFLLGMMAVTATTGDITSILFGIPGRRVHRLHHRGRSSHGQEGPGRTGAGGLAHELPHGRHHRRRRHRRGRPHRHAAGALPGDAGVLHAHRGRRHVRGRSERRQRRQGPGRGRPRLYLLAGGPGHADRHRALHFRLHLPVGRRRDRRRGHRAGAGHRGAVRDSRDRRPCHQGRQHRPGTRGPARRRARGRQGRVSPLVDRGPLQRHGHLHRHHPGHGRTRFPMGGLRPGHAVLGQAGPGGHRRHRGRRGARRGQQLDPWRRADPHHRLRHPRQRHHRHPAGGVSHPGSASPAPPC